MNGEFKDITIQNVENVTHQRVSTVRTVILGILVFGEINYEKNLIYFKKNVSDIDLRLFSFSLTVCDRKPDWQSRIRDQNLRWNQKSF